MKLTGRKVFALTAVLTFLINWAFPVKINASGTGGEDTVIAANTDFEKMAENNRYELMLLYSSQINIGVKDKISGHIWYSNPYHPSGASDSSASDRLKSQLRITYYDLANVKESKTMDSHKNAVAGGQCTVKKIKNGFRIEYVIGAPREERIVPQIISRKTYEDVILKKLADDEKAKNRLNVYYQLKSLDSVTDKEQKAQLIKEYPGLEKSDLYILTMANKKAQIELESYFIKAGFTREDMAQEYEKFGYASQQSKEASFYIPVEYTLEESGLSATIKTAEIEYNKKYFALYSINFLEFFGAAEKGSRGYLFIPDGTGSIIDFNNDGKKTRGYQTGKLYGMDISDSGDTDRGIYYQLPVFGLKNGDNAFFAIIQQGDAAASLTTEISGITHNYNTTYPTFTYCNKTQKETGDMVDTIWMMFEKNPAPYDFSIRYAFLTGEQANYAGMAALYRSYLEGLGMKRKQEQLNIPLYVETMGTIRSKHTFLGFSLHKNFPLTTFEDSLNILKKYKENSIDDVVLRLSGWYNNGYNGYIARNMNIAGVLGGKNALLELIQYCRENGQRLIPNMDFITFKQTRFLDGYSRKEDGIHTVDDKVTQFFRTNIATLKTDLKSSLNCVNPPSAYDNAKIFSKQLGRLGVDNASLEIISQTLSADYKKGRLVYRQDAMKYYQNLSELFGGEVMINGCNAYMLPYVDHITNIPVSDSEFIDYGVSVPFLQMVIRNYISYSAAPINLSGDVRKHVLKTIEYGAAPYFVLAKKNIQKLNEDMYYSSYYSVDSEYWLDESIKLYQAISSVLNLVQGADITSHQVLSQGVNLTGYSNGVSIIVNYTDQPFIYQGTTIQANSYSVFNN